MVRRSTVFFLLRILEFVPWFEIGVLMQSLDRILVIGFLRVIQPLLGSLVPICVNRGGKHVNGIIQQYARISEHRRLWQNEKVLFIPRV